ncbi:cupin domain-containing protein [Flavobacterium sp. SM15]|uniref:cupin domain-containing protein n=1 Tax=Flavobacterium sp. SM15 TaxID=2908005 RepID=UPI001EDA920B|nr:cupin domain-containing protein [Flavobacterium sp. SM15]MCG2611935.1 cupin domain-containing protein [Flavobacterium sp. SM15]
MEINTKLNTLKTIKLISKTQFIGLFLMLSAAMYGQDPIKVAPNAYKKVVLENEKVRVLEVEIATGETIPWHTHPNHVAYALTDAKIDITDKGKAPVSVDIKAGEALYIPAVTHMAKNVGGTTARLIVTEIKHPMAKKMKMPAEAKK